MKMKILVRYLLGLQAVRVRTHDSASAFLYRMPAGFAGDVNRNHPFSVEPTLISVARPPTAYGQAVTIDTVAADNSVRPFAAGDTALTVAYGFTVRPYPTQQTTGGMSSTFGAATPPVTGEIDVMRYGYMNVQCNVGALPLKGGAVFIWVAATSGAHIQGQFESAASGGNTLALDANRYMFNGPADSNNVTEIFVR